MCFWTRAPQIEHHSRDNDLKLKFFICGFFKNFSVFFGLGGSLFLSCLLAFNVSFVILQVMRSSASPPCCNFLTANSACNLSN